MGTNIIRVVSKLSFAAKDSRSGRFGRWLADAINVPRMDDGLGPVLAAVERMTTGVLCGKEPPTALTALVAVATLAGKVMNSGEHGIGHQLQATHQVTQVARHSRKSQPAGTPWPAQEAHGEKDGRQEKR